MEFIVGPLAANPHRLGTPLRREPAGLFSARRASYRILDRINDTDRVVEVVHIDQRFNVHRL